jgi:hypothetical protein
MLTEENKIDNSMISKALERLKNKKDYSSIQSDKSCNSNK